MRRPHYRMGRAACSCGKTVACDVPWQGDGSAYVYRRHFAPSGEKCIESRSIVPTSMVISEPCGWKRGWGAL